MDGSLETPLEQHAVHLFDASYMGFSSSANHLAQRILDAWATLPPTHGLPAADRPLRPGVFEILIGWSNPDKAATIRVTEPDGAEVSNQDLTGSGAADPSAVSGFMEAYVTDQDKGKRAAYVVGLEDRMKPGTYKVVVDLIEKKEPNLVDGYVRAGSRFYHGLIDGAGSTQKSFVVATVRYSTTGEFSIKGKLD